MQGFFKILTIITGLTAYHYHNKKQLGLELIRACNKLGTENIEEKNKAIERIKSLVLQGADLNLIDDEGVALFATVVYNNIEITELLLMNGADPDIADNNGFTSLHRCDSLEMIKLLIRYKADINKMDKKNDLAFLSFAIWRKDYELVKFLVDNGVRLDITKKNLTNS